MSFMERSNWEDPNNRRRIRIFIPLAVGLVLVVSLIVAVNSKMGLIAFGGAPGCPSASASASATAGRPLGRIPGRRLPKGAEAVKAQVTPAASPTASPATKRAGDTSSTAPSPPASAATGTADPGTSAGTGTPDPSTSAGTGMPDPSTSAGTGMPDPSTSPSASAGPSSCPTGGTEADPNPNCTLIVPPDPLSAQGLARPYRLTAGDAAKGACNETNASQSAFVQATIIDPATGRLSVYNPLVVDQRTRPAARPVIPALPARAVVGIWFGYNGDNLTLRGADNLRQGTCVNGLGGSIFGQYAYCNAPAFFTAANAAIKAGKLKVPALGTATDGMPCMTTRDFALVDQDQSDNVTTHYLATGDGRVAQDTAANRARLAGARTLANPSDNGLLDAFVDPALGCTPWKAPDLADKGAMVTSLALDELQADAHQAAPSALVPQNNPMTLVDDLFSVEKTNLYRAGVNQPALPAGQTPEEYCRAMDTMQPPRLQKNEKALTAAASPMPAEADSLFTFMGMRLQESFGNLKCENFGLTNPVAKLTTKDGVVVGVTFAGNGEPGDPGVPGKPCPTVTPTPAARTGAAAAQPASPSPAPTACATPSPAPSGKAGHPRRGGRPPRN